MPRPKGSKNKEKEVVKTDSFGNLIILNNSTQTENKEVPQEVKKLELKHAAYSMVFIPETKKWAAIEIPFDLTNKVMGEPTIVEQNTDRHIILERFQILISRNLM